MTDIFSTIEKIAAGKGFARTGELDKDYILLDNFLLGVQFQDTAIHTPDSLPCLVLGGAEGTIFIFK